LELLRTLGEAHGELRKQSAPEVIVGLLASCQEFAQRIGEYIEDIEGEGTQTVALLEEYCELVYNASVGAGGTNHSKKLQAQLVKIENSVRAELKPDRIEAAFLSYNASMSDSILSIYLAAKADPACDAYWIPIPYYERNAGGTLGALRYEGADCYGKNVECTDWQKYDVEARRPDVIFTFAPYDAGNYVTSVHPDFYCERLRGLTDLLVYVPYFVTGDDVQEHFCTVAGCVFAHKVVLESEKIRSIYIRAFKNAYGNRFGKPEDKFVALGSPKYDAVINTRREDCELPPEWARIIKDKKVVLYNTTVGAILQDSEQYLKKLRAVIEMFRGRDDVALWWRPHPLNEATFSSMRPALAAEYRQIVDAYKRNIFGIFDDTPDFHRAIAVSDAYYGDGSSVVALYQATGKPAFIQGNIRNTGEDQFLENSGHSLTPISLYDDGFNFWFIAMHFNALFKTDKTTFHAEYICTIPNENFFHYDQSYGMIPAENNGILYFAPCMANEIFAVNLKNNEFMKIPFEIAQLTDLQKAQKFGKCVAINDYVWFVPYRYPAIMRYNTTTGELTYFNEFVDEITQACGRKDILFFHQSDVNENKLILPCFEADIIIIFDMDSCQYEAFDLNSASNLSAPKLLGAVHYEDNYFIISASGRLFKSKLQDHNEMKSVEILNLPVKNFGNLLFYPFFVQDGFLYLFKSHSDKSLKINLTTLNVENLEQFDGTFDLTITEYLSVLTDKENLYAVNRKKTSVYKMSLADNSVTEKHIFLPESEFAKLVIDYALTDTVDLTPINAAVGDSGKKIYDYCKKEVVK
jgi:hypothetical protein